MYFELISWKRQCHIFDWNDEEEENIVGRYKSPNAFPRGKLNENTVFSCADKSEEEEAR